MSDPLPIHTEKCKQKNGWMTLEVFAADEARVDVEVRHGDGTELLKVKVQEHPASMDDSLVNSS